VSGESGDSTAKDTRGNATYAPIDASSSPSAENLRSQRCVRGDVCVFVRGRGKRRKDRAWHTILLHATTTSLAVAWHRKHLHHGRANTTTTARRPAGGSPERLCGRRSGAACRVPRFPSPRTGFAAVELWRRRRHWRCCGGTSRPSSCCCRSGSTARPHPPAGRGPWGRRPASPPRPAGESSGPRAPCPSPGAPRFAGETEEEEEGGGGALGRWTSVCVRREGRCS
jgi:hypothetical protein